MVIFDIVMPDGTRVDSVEAAVKKFMCPGPCSPDCALYQQIQVRHRVWGHMCHPENVRRYPFQVLDAMRCSYSTRVGDDAGTGPGSKARYAAVIRASAVRDVQFCRDAELDPADDDTWADLPEAEIWLGLFQGRTALEDAAKYAGTDPANIRLIPIDEEPEKKEENDA